MIGHKSDLLRTKYGGESVDEVDSLVLTGTKMEAVYRRQELKQYRGNPMIEALPKIMVGDEAVEKMYVMPTIGKNEKKLPAELIYNSILYNLPQIFQVFARHKELQIAVSAQIRNGYVGRMPYTPEFIKKARVNDIKNLVAEPTTYSFALIGPSGIGKSRALKIILLNYPQTIYHTMYKNKKMPFTQLVWLKVDCPSRASVKTLGYNILGAIDNVLGTGYREKALKNRLSADDIVNEVGNKCHIHAVGLLAIDEVQRLKNAQEGPSVLLEFFVSMMDRIGTPLILVGTNAAASLFTNAFANARRNTGFGNFVWDRLDNDGDWEELIEMLFRYQWTSQNADYKDFINIFYQISQGIADIAVKLYAMCQWKAVQLKRDYDCITKELVEDVALKSLRLVAPMLNALRKRDYKALDQWPDMCLSWNDVRLMMGAENVNINQGNNNQEEYSASAREVIIWLREAGVSVEDAETAVKEAIDKWGESDLGRVRRYAYKNAHKKKSTPKSFVKNKNENHNSTEDQKDTNDLSGMEVLSYVLAEEDVT